MLPTVASRGSNWGGRSVCVEPGDQTWSSQSTRTILRNTCERRRHDSHICSAHVTAPSRTVTTKPSKMSKTNPSGASAAGGSPASSRASSSVVIRYGSGSETPSTNNTLAVAGGDAAQGVAGVESPMGVYMTIPSPKHPSVGSADALSERSSGGPEVRRRPWSAPALRGCRSGSGGLRFRLGPPPSLGHQCSAYRRAR